MSMQKDIRAIVTSLVESWDISWRAGGSCTLVCTPLEDGLYRLSFSAPITELEADTLDFNLRQIGLKLEVSERVNGTQPVYRMLASVVDEQAARAYFNKAKGVNPS